jgi:hypothetical protein
MIDVLKAQRKGDRQCRRLALCARVEKAFLKDSSPLVWIWETAPVRTAFYSRVWPNSGCSYMMRWQSFGGNKVDIFFDLGTDCFSIPLKQREPPKAYLIL